MRKIIVILTCLFLMACGDSDSKTESPPSVTEGGEWDKSNWDDFEWE